MVRPRGTRTLTSTTTLARPTCIASSVPPTPRTTPACMSRIVLHVQVRKVLFQPSKLSKYMGMDVTSLMSVPLFIMEPFSMLQKMAEIMEYTQLLDVANAEEDPYQRCVQQHSCDSAAWRSRPSSTWSTVNAAGLRTASAARRYWLRGA